MSETTERNRSVLRSPRARSGMCDRLERRKVMGLAQARQIDVVLVTELSCWGRSTTDLLATLKELEARRVSLIALNGMAFDLSTPHGRMIATVLAGIADALGNPCRRVPRFRKMCSQM